MIMLSSILPCFAYGNTIEFSDLSMKHWAYNYISKMIEKDIVSGYSDKTFRPDNNVTRAEWSKLLVQTAGIPIPSFYETVIESCSLDAKTNKWYNQYLVAMIPYFDFFESGTPDSKRVMFFPDQDTTRIEVVKSIITERGYDLTDVDCSPVFLFKDCYDIASDDIKYVAKAIEKGIINGFNDLTFRPNACLTRAEACAILYRTYIDVPAPTKPYKLSKLVSAEINEAIMATTDGSNNLVYIDAKDNCVYKINLLDRKKVKYFDANTLSHEVLDEGQLKKYTSFIARQVYYDSLTGDLLLCGMYESLAESGKAPIQNGKFTFIYDISSPNSAEVFCKPYFTESRGYWTNIQTRLSKDRLFIGGSFEGEVDIDTGKRETFNLPYGGSAETVVLANYKNNLYYYTYHSNIGYISGQVQKYDFSEDAFVPITDNIFSRSFGQNANAYYFMGIDIVNKDDDDDFFKVDLDTRMIEKLNITLDSNLTEYMDMSGTDSLAEYFYVINENAIILYDYDMEAFRVLENVYAFEPAEVKPYRVGTKFYSPYIN